MFIFKSRYQPDLLALTNGKQLVINVIVAGIRNDLRSGSQVDFCVLHLDGTSKYTRYVVAKGELQEHFEKQWEDHEDGDAGTNLGVNVFALKSKRVLWVSETESKRLQPEPNSV